MQSHPDHSDEPPSARGNGRIWMAVSIAAVVAIIVALHLAGVIGPGSH